GKELWQRPHKGYPAALVFFPADRQLLLATNDTQSSGPPVKITYLGSHLYLWDAATGQENRRWDGPKTGIGPAVLGPDGQTVPAGSRDGSIQVWETATGKELRQFPGRLGSACCLSRDGRVLATGGMDRHIRVWDVATGKERGASGGHDDSIT